MTEMTELVTSEQEKLSPKQEPVSDKRPYTIDPENLCEYYKKLDPVEIDNDVVLMKVASTKELFELIASNCQRYVSIIEHYKKENLQTLFNVAIRRIEGHLLIKFKMNTNDRWIEVGFFDDNNTDKETLEELKKMIHYYLKNYDIIGQQRRSHIALQFDQQSTPTKTQKQALPDNYFDPKENPELAISERQKQSAGYTPVPKHLKNMIPQMKSQQSFNLSDFQGDMKQTSTKQPLKQPTIQPKMLSLDQIMRKGSTLDQQSFNELTCSLDSQQYLSDIFKGSIDLLKSSPTDQHVYIYQFLSEIVDRQKPINMVNFVMKLMCGEESSKPSI